MKSRQLSKALRESIVNKLIEKKFKDAERLIADRRKFLAQAVYDDKYSLQQQELMNSLPNGWMETLTYVRAQFGTQYTNLPLPESLRVPYADRYNAQASYAAGHRLTRRFAEIQNDAEDLARDKKVLTDNTMAVLNSVNSTKQLLEVWPEVRPILESVMPDTADRNLPALPINNLNLEFGLQAA